MRLDPVQEQSEMWALLQELKRRFWCALDFIPTRWRTSLAPAGSECCVSASELVECPLTSPRLVSSSRESDSGLHLWNHFLRVTLGSERWREHEKPTTTTTTTIRGTESSLVETCVITQTNSSDLWGFRHKYVWECLFSSQVWFDLFQFSLVFKSDGEMKLWSFIEERKRLISRYFSFMRTQIPPCWYKDCQIDRCSAGQLRATMWGRERWLIHQSLLPLCAWTDEASNVLYAVTRPKRYKPWCARCTPFLDLSTCPRQSHVYSDGVCDAQTSWIQTHEPNFKLSKLLKLFCLRLSCNWSGW